MLNVDNSVEQCPSLVFVLVLYYNDDFALNLLLRDLNNGIPLPYDLLRAHKNIRFLFVSCLGDCLVPGQF